MANYNIQLEDNNGNLLFPKIRTTNVINDAGFLVMSDLSDLISSSLKRQVVESLPTENIQANVVYMVLKDASDSSAGAQNIYNEYLYINGQWELIGDSATSLVGYATESYVQTTLQDYAPLASPALTGTPTAPNMTADSSDSQIANKKYVDDTVAALNLTYEVLSSDSDSLSI